MYINSGIVTWQQHRLNKHLNTIILCVCDPSNFQPIKCLVPETLRKAGAVHKQTSLLSRCARTQPGRGGQLGCSCERNSITGDRRATSEDTLTIHNSSNIQEKDKKETTG